jgi:thioredoxin reductase (NADPH)
VTIIHRRDEFRAQPLLVERAHRNGKIDFALNTTVEEIVGDGARVKKLRLHQAGSGHDEKLEVGGVFIFIGFLPNTGLIRAHADHDAQGYYLTDANMMTSVPGIYAAGDVRAQLTRQVTTAVGDATTAALAATKQVEADRAAFPPRLSVAGA